MALLWFHCGQEESLRGGGCGDGGGGRGGWVVVEVVGVEMVGVVMVAVVVGAGRRFGTQGGLLKLERPW